MVLCEKIQVGELVSYILATRWPPVCECEHGDESGLETCSSLCSFLTGAPNLQLSRAIGKDLPYLTRAYFSFMCIHTGSPGKIKRIWICVVLKHKMVKECLEKVCAIKLIMEFL